MKIGIISDIHEDIESLSKAMLELEKRNCDLLICLGDIAGFDKRFYSYINKRNLNKCIDSIKTNCKYSLIGNHDLFVIKKNPSPNPVFDYPDHWYSLPLNERKILSKGLVWNFEHDLTGNLSNEETDYLDSLPEFIVLEDSGMRIFISHSVYPDLPGMLTLKPMKHKDFSFHFNKLLELTCNIGISGHFHPNGIIKINSKIRASKFWQQSIGESLTQFICPCIADGMQDNGYTILDIF